MIKIQIGPNLRKLDTYYLLNDNKMSIEFSFPNIGLCFDKISKTGI